MPPRHPGWKALAEAVTPSGRVMRLRRLAGAGMTDAYDVTLDRSPSRVVVKLYRDGDGTAASEWSRLQFAQRVSVPVPEPITADLRSVWFGRPAIVMSRLPGRPELNPKDVDSWVGALARTLADLHSPMRSAASPSAIGPRYAAGAAERIAMRGALLADLTVSVELVTFGCQVFD